MFRFPLRQFKINKSEHLYVRCFCGRSFPLWGHEVRGVDLWKCPFLPSELLPTVRASQNKWVNLLPDRGSVELGAPALVRARECAFWTDPGSLLRWPVLPPQYSVRPHSFPSTPLQQDDQLDTFPTQAHRDRYRRTFWFGTDCKMRKPRF